MKKSNVFIAFILLVFLLVGCDGQTNNDNSGNSAIITDDKQMAKEVKNIEKIIMTDSAQTIDEWDTVDHFIDNYKDRDEVKGELRNFIVNKCQEYIDKGQNNKNIFDKLFTAVSRLYIDYPNDATVVSLEQQFNDIDSKNNPDNTTNTQQTQPVQQPQNITSSDGNLELLDKSSSDGYVIGTIQNKSNNIYSYVEVDINLYDEQDNQVGSTLANVNNLQPNSQWKFKAVVLDQKSVKKFRIIKITGNL